MRKDQQLSENYRKDKNFEAVLSSMNNALNNAQKDILFACEEQFPTMHVIGAPRSGTTLITQLMASGLQVGYINNLIAAFWKSPMYGIELSKKLIQKPYISNFTSNFGRTNGIQEPHEFGYFWNYHLKYDDLSQKGKKHEKNIDWQGLSHLLKNMTASFNQPVLFKSFLLGFHANAMFHYLSKSQFIYIERNLVDNALSLLKLRKKLNGDMHTWGSIKPLQYEVLKKMPVYEQVVGQVLCLEYEYMKELEKLPNSNKLFYKYEKICSDPVTFLTHVKNKFMTKPAISIAKFNSFKIQSNSSEIEKKEINLAKNKVFQTIPYLKNIR